jgi:phosphatidylserine/phosphatidylglycerophosphate/cardiolipin synthase-like enzyme
MTTPPPDSSFDLVGTGTTDRTFTDALTDLFSGNGTIYLVTGFFTYNGYRSIRDDIIDFVNRSPQNTLEVVVGPSSDQFSARIAKDLWAIDPTDQISIYKRSRGLHAKLYLRDGPNPYLILTSANLTQVGFHYNIELGMELESHHEHHPQITAFTDWVTTFVANSDPLTKRDIFTPLLIGNSILNWTNKGRLLPRRYVLRKLLPIAILIIALSTVIQLI